MKSAHLVSAATIGLVALTGCALAGRSGPASASRAAGPSHADAVISRSEIQSSGVQTVWDALRLTSSLKLTTDSRGRPISLLFRGHKSISLDDTPLIVMDGAVLSNLYTLADMPATDLQSIYVWSSTEAPIRYANMASSGVVEIRTMQSGAR